jgi:FlaA1/EpsC-like NDP-sugar epimerase
MENKEAQKKKIIFHLDDVPNLEGKTIMVVGATGAIGKEVTTILLLKGASL